MEWLALAVSQLRSHGASQVVQAVGEGEGGREAYLLEFTLHDQRYKVVWPVLPLAASYRTDKNQEAARRQAATSLYHDVKARCVTAARYGSEMGFFQFRQLPDGRTVQEMTAVELMEGLPRMMHQDATRRLEYVQ